MAQMISIRWQVVYAVTAFLMGFAAVGGFHHHG